MAASSLWRKFLNENDIFKLLRKNCEKNTVTPNSKDVVAVTDGELFVWDACSNSVLTTNLKLLAMKSAAASKQPQPQAQSKNQHSDQNMQRNEGSSNSLQLLCSCPPSFEVDSIILSPSASRLALVGMKGIAVMELPKQGEKYENSEKIFCKTTVVGERLLMTGSRVLMQAAWHPASDNDRHLLLLTSDNRMSLYSLREPHRAAQTWSLDETFADYSAVAGGGGADDATLCRPYQMALGDSAVAFDFAPPIELVEKRRPCATTGAATDTATAVAWPVFILWGNGDIYSLLTSVDNKKLVDRLQGPLSMHPPAEDNYGTDACSIRCLGSRPSVLVIATSQGVLYHCVVLEQSDDADNDDGESSWGAPPSVYRPAPRSSLYIYESVQLQLSLTTSAPSSLDSSLVDDFGSHIRLHKDPQLSDRYYCSHSAGLHAVVLPWTQQLKQFCSAADESTSLQVDADQQAIVEHLICTKPVSSSVAVPVLGVCLISDRLLETTLICLLATYECITIPLLHNWRKPSPMLISEMPMEKMPSPLKKLYKEPFEERIRKILQRTDSNPLLRGDDKTELSPQQCLELLCRSTQVFREQHLQKQALAYDEISKRVHILRELKQQQTAQLANCEAAKRRLVSDAHGLAEKYDGANDKQQQIVSRLEMILQTMQSHMPQLSDAERNMNVELAALDEKLKKMTDDIVQIRKKFDYQKKLRESAEEEKNQPGKVKGFDQKQTAQLKSVLREEGNDIEELIRRIQNVQVNLET